MAREAICENSGVGSMDLDCVITLMCPGGDNNDAVGSERKLEHSGQVWWTEGGGTSLIPRPLFLPAACGRGFDWRIGVRLLTGSGVAET